MQNVISPKKMREIEERAFKNTTAEERMLKARGQLALHLTAWIEQNHHPRQVLLLAGKGNNGGDGYTACCLLLHKGFKVLCWAIHEEGDPSPLNQKRRRDFEQLRGVVVDIKESPFPPLPKQHILLDGLFGIGFQGKTTGII